MNKRALFFGLLYSLLVIVFKLAILFQGNTFTKFGFYYANVLSYLAIIPFAFVCVWQVREKDYAGFIGGREAIRLGFTILAVSVVLVSVYNYVEQGSELFKTAAVKYYNSSDYLAILNEQQQRHPDKLKVEDFPKIISEQITAISPFKAATYKLPPMLFFGLVGSFMAAVTLRRKAKT